MRCPVLPEYPQYGDMRTQIMGAIRARAKKAEREKRKAIIADLAEEIKCGSALSGWLHTLKTNHPGRERRAHKKAPAVAPAEAKPL